MKINYVLRKSGRARRVRLTVQPGGRIVVTIPHAVAFGAAERFITEKRDWLMRAVARMRKIPPKIALPRGLYREKRIEAKKIILGRIQELNAKYQFSFNTVTIRNQKTRWGSCSRKGNLSFNYRLILLPSELMDYVIVHELCHLAEFNHSRRFWELVMRIIPDALAARQTLRRYDLRLA
jgi:predicted metal-dependent hydrolase